jgi:hypothetical protein
MTAIADFFEAWMRVNRWRRSPRYAASFRHVLAFAEKALPQGVVHVAGRRGVGRGGHPICREMVGEQLGRLLQ